MRIPSALAVKAWVIVLLAWAYLLPRPALSQTYNQFVGFGDSTIDSGWYRNPATPPNSTNAIFNADFAIAVTQGGGKATTNPGSMSSEALASFFGLTAIPANQPGGTNYATGDAMNSLPTTTGNAGAVPTATQIANYLTANGGTANPNALYVISSGGNDALAAGATTATVTTAVNALVATVVQLQNAGARYIIVPNLPATISGNPLLQDYNNTLWPGLAAAGINFVPADINSVLAAVKGNAAFGFTATGPACTQPAGITSGWATLCSTTSTVSTLVSPDAAQTHLFADNIHLSTAGQRIVADYEYSLLVAPSEISYLAEVPVKMRAGIVNAIWNQIPISFGQRGAYHGWITGDVSWLKMENDPNFPSDPGTPAAVTGGFDYRFMPDWILGVAFSLGQTTQSFSLGGDFTINEVAVSAYAGYRHDPYWFNIAATWGSLRFDVNREVPIGITTQSNLGSTSGYNISLGGEAGYDFAHVINGHEMKDGPIVGVLWQRSQVHGFTETDQFASTGGFTALSYEDQIRYSAVSELGYQASIKLGLWQPFAKLTWNHEWADSNRLVTASLTTVAAPSYSLPAVMLGEDWGAGTVGTRVQIGSSATAYAALIAQLGQDCVVEYGGQFGISLAINP
jgi:outer membrane lipase/esterase